MPSALKYKRVMIKLSGEALAGNEKSGIDSSVVSRLASEIGKAVSSGFEIALVIGGGNIFRGGTGEALGVERTSGDHMGMLATVINAIAMNSALSSLGIDSRVMTAFEMNSVAEFYTIREARKHLDNKSVVLLSGGTGNPFFTTDTAACLRAAEIKADIVIKATKVSGVYDKDPEKNEDAVKFNKISYIEVLKRQLRVMDLTAISFCMENNLPIMVLNLFEENSIINALRGISAGTIISNEEVL